MPVIKMLTCKSFQNSPQRTRLTRQIKISGPELIFYYLLHLANLILGMTVFALLIQFDQEYASTIEKVRVASGFSMSALIFHVCPAALLLSAITKLAYQRWAEPWKKMGSSEKWTARQCLPKPKSKIVSKKINFLDADIPEQDILDAYIPDADIPKQDIPEHEAPEPTSPGPVVQNIHVEE